MTPNYLISVLTVVFTLGCAHKPKQHAFVSARDAKGKLVIERPPAPASSATRDDWLPENRMCLAPKPEPKQLIWLGYLLVDKISRRVAFLFMEDNYVSTENAVAPLPRQDGDNTVFDAPSSMFEKAEVILRADNTVVVRYHIEECTIIGPVQNIGAHDSAAGISGVAYKAYFDASTRVDYSPECGEVFRRHANQAPIIR